MPSPTAAPTAVHRARRNSPSVPLATTSTATGPAIGIEPTKPQISATRVTRTIAPPL